MTIRVATFNDTDALLALWIAAGLTVDECAVPVELRSLLDNNPDLVLVDDEDGIIGSVIGSFDGRRGWINRLATHPERLGEGRATALMHELELRLIAKGCTKVNLAVEPANAAVVPFYRNRGFKEENELIFMEKWLTTTDPAPSSNSEVVRSVS